MTRLYGDNVSRPFGEAALSLLDRLFPKMYQTTLVLDPTFSEIGRANIQPQIDAGDFFVISYDGYENEQKKLQKLVKRFSNSQNIEEDLDLYRYEYALFVSCDMSVLTAWAQSEYAIVALRIPLLSEKIEWIEDMRKIEAIREIS